MFQEHAEHKIKQFIQDFEKLTNSISWGIDKRIRMSIAAQYMTSDKNFDAKYFLDVADYIKKETGFFSTLTSENRYVLAGLLITQFTDPYNAFSQLKDYYEALIKSGFRKGPYTYLSAYSLLTHQNIEENHATKANRALEIYKAMRTHHFFITSNDDYPLSVLLSQMNVPTDSLMDEIEFYYSYLGKREFRKGNDLQFLSHILTYGQSENRQQLADNALQYVEQLRKEKIKIKGIHYPAIGVLSLIDTAENTLSDILSAVSLFNKEKLFRWYTEMSLVLSIQLFVQEKIDDKSVFSIGMATSIQAILQAQQAASVASITAASAAASSSTIN